MILAGLVLGRWWKAALVVAAVGWPLLLIAYDVVPVHGAWTLADAGTLLGGALLAVLNAAVGVALHQALLWLVRGLRHVITRRSAQLCAKSKGP
jgi:hypothetical protein